jgi:hypothetical protein
MMVAPDQLTCDLISYERSGLLRRPLCTEPDERQLQPMLDCLYTPSRELRSVDSFARSASGRGRRPNPQRARRPVRRPVPDCLRRPRPEFLLGQIPQLPVCRTDQRADQGGPGVRSAGDGFAGAAAGGTPGALAIGSSGRRRWGCRSDPGAVRTPSSFDVGQLFGNEPVADDEDVDASYVAVSEVVAPAHDDSVACGDDLLGGECAVR